MRPVDAGPVAGWVCDGGPHRALLLHGGPGLGFEYLDGLTDEISPAWTVASFQQRGLGPATLDGPFDLDTAVADVARFLDALGWDRAVLVGHSWGGHLALHVAVALPDRVEGILGVDPLGAVGDGGARAFEESLLARIAPEQLAALADVTDELDGLRIVWPGYAADPSAAPPFPEIRLSAAAGAGLHSEIRSRMSALEAALPRITAPLGIVAGGASPMPVSAAPTWSTACPEPGSRSSTAPATSPGSNARAGWAPPSTGCSELRAVRRVRTRSGHGDGRGPGGVGQHLGDLLDREVRERSAVPQGVDDGRAERVTGPDRVRDLDRQRGDLDGASRADPGGALPPRVTTTAVGPSVSRCAAASARSRSG